MKFDPRDAMLLIAAWPDMQIRPEILYWAFTARIRRIEPFCIRDIVCAYNMAIRDIALKSPYNHFVFIEKDVWPIDLKPFVESQADVVGAHYPIEDERSWDNPTTFHTGAWRCHRRVLEAIAPPWFMPVYAPDGTRVTRCGCLVLRDRILAGGFTIERAGKCGHKPVPTMS